MYYTVLCIPHVIIITSKVSDVQWIVQHNRNVGFIRVVCGIDQDQVINCTIHFQNKQVI